MVNRNNPSTCTCKNGFYEKNERCIPCVLPCIWCTAEDVCTKKYDCDPHTSGYYAVAAPEYCRKCQYPCLTCNSASNCLSCGYDMENRKAASSNCVCKDGFFERD